MIDATRRLLVLVLLAALVGAGPAGAQALQKRINARLGAPPLDHSLWGVVLMNTKGKQLYGRNAERMFIPASNTKLVVSAVAAALFPPDWTVTTSVYADAPIRDGVVEGDLVLYGRGDPTMGRRCYAVDTTAPGACDTDPFLRLRDLAGQLRARSVTTVQGDLVGDGSWFDGELINIDWEIYDLNWWYAAPVSGLGFNDNSIDFTYAPGPTLGAPATITFTPDFGTVAFENRTRTVAAGKPTTIDFYREPGTLRVWAEGDVALDSRGRNEYFALPDPALYTAWALRAVLADSGIAVLGTSRSTVDSTEFMAARQGAPLAEVASRPVKDWIFPILNTSQNWFAEMLLEAARAAVRNRRVVEGGPRRGAALPHRLDAGGLAAVLAPRRLRPLELQSGVAASLCDAAGLDAHTPAVRVLCRGPSAVGPARITQVAIHRHTTRRDGAREDGEHQPGEHPVRVHRATWAHAGLFGGGE